jgi:hypothetical protein
MLSIYYFLLAFSSVHLPIIFPFGLTSYKLEDLEQFNIQSVEHDYTFTRLVTPKSSWTLGAELG